MIEKLFCFNQSYQKLIERVVSDDNLDLNHIILPLGNALPEHYSNSHVYLIVVRGTMTIQLGEQDANEYPAGHIVNVPYKTKMNISNAQEPMLEFFVIKAPSPKNMN